MLYFINAIEYLDNKWLSNVVFRDLEDAWEYSLSISSQLKNNNENNKQLDIGKTNQLDEIMETNA